MKKAGMEKKSGSLWPVFIIIGLVLFIGYISFMVYQAMQTDVGLVRQDYYEQTLTYQNQIDTETRTNALSSPISITTQAPSQLLTIRFPADFVGKEVTGTIQLFRPSNQALDVEVPLQLDAALSQTLSTATLEKGRWRVKLRAEAGGKPYFVDQEITLE